MTISDEILMAYADGELDAAAREAVESAMREDPQIEKRVAAHRALRRRVQAAYSVELSEDVPESLLRAARAAGTQQAKVVNLQDARAAMERAASCSRPPWPEWRIAGTIAASLIAGVGLDFSYGGKQAPVCEALALSSLRATRAGAVDNSPPNNREVRLCSRGEPGKSGDYCRTFVSRVPCHRRASRACMAKVAGSDPTGTRFCR
jgi:hypothetical protein